MVRSRSRNVNVIAFFHGISRLSLSFQSADSAITGSATPSLCAIMPRMSTDPHIFILGGGAAGFFAAITCAEANPRVRVTVLEKSRALLSKVRISGGGRCNVTHACFDPALLAQHYPRGGAVLRGPFSRFQPRDTIAWFEQRGVSLKTESDGRVFPVTDRSETIVECLLNAAQQAGVTIRTQMSINSI